MKNLLALGLCTFGVVSVHAQPPLDQLLENVAPILQAPEAYHTPEEAREGEAPLALTLDCCVAMALEANSGVLEAGANVALRGAESGQARSRRLPQVKAEAAYNYIDNLESGIGAGVLAGLIDTSAFTPDKATTTTRLTITQVLFAGGQIQAAVKASRYLAASEAWRRDAVRAEVAFQARQAYHDALLARSATAVAEEALEAFGRHVHDTEILESEGALTSFEVMRAKSELAARRSDQVAARAAVQLADLNVRRILALPEDQPLAYDAKIPWTPIEGAAGELTAEAREHRPELRALRDALAAAEQQERAVKGKYLPQAAATATWVNVDGGGKSTPDGWQFNVGAQWDIYRGGQRKYERAAARARSEDLRYQLADLERLVAVEVEGAFVRMREAEAAIRAGNESVALAEESVRLAMIRYREGIGTQTEIIDAELARTRAKTALVQAVRDYFVADASVRRAAGRDTAAGATVESNSPIPATAGTGP